ncbi:hypothetical protein [Sphingomonas montanisoli]|uniref:hypothetical protein n=1 Tax=Sphingomonas montanisoli TaxID=2606412 RepID=UPI001FE4E594|nr:hypothetical protein [Sphingomonas montanisoli]
MAAKKLIETRRRRGKGLESRITRNHERVSSADLVKAYQEDTARKRDMIRRANNANDRLILVVEALRRLRADASFVAILEEVGLDDIPDNLARRFELQGSAS